MQEQQLESLSQAFTKMTDRDRAVLVKYAWACARENPRKPHLRLVVGGARGVAAGNDFRHSDDLLPTFGVRSGV